MASLTSANSARPMVVAGPPQWRRPLRPIASGASSMIWTAAGMGGAQVSGGGSTQQQPPSAALPASAEEGARRASDAMGRYACGDDTAFDELYSLLSPRLYRLCSYLQGSTDAGDLLQEVMLKMHRYRYQFKPGGNVVSWAYAITRTTAIDRQRRRRRRPEEVMAPSHWDQCAGVAANNPEAAAVRGELEVSLQRHLGRLSERQRSAYVLVRLEGLSMAEAGRMLGATQATVKQRVHRASEALKLALASAEP